MSAPTHADLIDALADATRRAVTDLFATHPDDHFYYCSLITTGEAHAPVLCAWSREALQAYGRREGLEAAELLDVKWSYADSPFCCFGENHFAEVRQLFDARPPAETEAEYDARLEAMEKAVARLDAEGRFGKGAERRNIVVNVEVMPPDETNTARASRLNLPVDIEVEAP